MICDQYITIKLTNNREYWRERGFNVDAVDLTVPASMLPESSNKKVSCHCDACFIHFQTTYQSARRQGEFQLCGRCTRVSVGLKMSTEKISEANAKRAGSRHPRFNPRKSDFESYRNRVRGLTEKNYNLNRDLVNPRGHARSRCGVDGGWQLDHIRSIYECFHAGVSAEQCASLDNLQMLSWKDNRAKSARQRINKE